MSSAIQKFRNGIHELETEMQKIDCSAELEVKHHFAQKVYARELFIPADCTLTGKIHKNPCINVISKGRIYVATEEGNKLVKAPCTFVSPAGTKRAGYAITDTIWITFHHTEETDLEKIENEVIAKNFLEFEEYRKKLERE